MKVRPQVELPFFFGPGDALFGVYHGVAAAAGRAVLLCAPLGQEQIRCHRLYRQLASSLATAGIPVLRFDYYGTGDAAGASGEVDLDRCIVDTAIAAGELRRRSGATDIVAFGVRLGGSLAMRAATASGFAEVVAWDPIVDGAAHVALMDTMQRALRVDAQRFPRARQESDIAGQWLGFDVRDTLRAQVAALRIAAVVTPTLVFDAAPESHPLRGVANVEVAPLLPAASWQDLARLEMAVLSHPLIQAVARHVEATA